MPYRRQWQSPFLWLTVLFLGAEYVLCLQAFNGTHILRWDIVAISVVMLCTFLGLLRYAATVPSPPVPPPTEPKPEPRAEPIKDSDSGIVPFHSNPPRRPG